MFSSERDATKSGNNMFQKQIIQPGVQVANMYRIFCLHQVSQWSEACLHTSFVKTRFKYLQQTTCGLETSPLEVFSKSDRSIKGEGGREVCVWRGVVAAGMFSTGQYVGWCEEVLFMGCDPGLCQVDALRCLCR